MFLPCLVGLVLFMYLLTSAFHFLLLMYVLSSTHHAYGAISLFMAIAAILQLSLISKREWDSLFGKVDKIREHASERSRHFRRSSSQLLKRMLSVGESGDDTSSLDDVSSSKEKID